MANSRLPKRRLGRTGFEVTALGLGGAHLGRTPDGLDDDLAIATVHRALELGVNLIDTAPMYWQSERRVGLALEAWYRKGGRREDFFLSTKTGRGEDGTRYYSKADTLRGVQESLRLLRTDYLDVVQVHDPDELSVVLEPGGAIEALKELKERGVVRAIGLGARPHEFHRRCIETGAFDVVQSFLDYNLVSQTVAEGVLATAAAHDVGVLNGAAVILGLLSGRDPREFPARQETPRAIELWNWAQERHVDLLALNLQFCLRETRITSTLVGCASPAQVEADVAALSEAISDSVWQELHELLGTCARSADRPQPHRPCDPDGSK